MLQFNTKQEDTQNMLLANLCFQEVNLKYATPPPFMSQSRQQDLRLQDSLLNSLKRTSLDEQTRTFLLRVHLKHFV
jgi:hypothetical protein